MFEYKKEDSIKALAVAVVVMSIWQMLGTNPFETAFEYRLNSWAESYSLKALGLFTVYDGDRHIGDYNNIEYAIKASDRHNNASIIFTPLNKEVYSSHSQFIVYNKGKVMESFDSASEAIDYAKGIKNSFIFDSKEKRLLYTNFDRSIAWVTATKQGDLFLTNQWNPIGSNYVIEDFVNLSAKRNEYIQPRLDNMLLDRKAFLDFHNMARDAHMDGVTNMIITSAYRSYATQRHLFDSRVQRLMQNYDRDTAIKMTATSIAIPGTSEHQTGLAVDITTYDRNGNLHPLNESFVNTKVGAWARDNSWKYGFVVRYDGAKSDITGIIYEPWHLRYVGIPHAEIMYKLDYCLEEYLEYLGKEKVVSFVDFKGDSYKIMYFDSIYSQSLITKLLESNNIVSISSDGNFGVILTISI